MKQKKEKIKDKHAAKVSMGPISMVAMEQNFPTAQQIIHDDLAYQMLTGLYRFFIRLTRKSKMRDKLVGSYEKYSPGLYSGMMCRKRYIDDKLISEINIKDSVKAFVNLGSGYDTRAYRLPDLANVPVWEVDLPVNIVAKQKVLQKVLAEIPSNITLVSIDFNEKEIRPVLESKGFDLNTKTFFIWEAVSQYLTETGVRQTFDFLAQAPTGSRLAFTYIRNDFIEGTNLYNQEKIYENLVIKKRLWHFGFDPDEVADFLSEYGWGIVEHLGYDDLAELYVKPTGRELSTMAIERMVYAEKL